MSDYELKDMVTHLNAGDNVEADKVFASAMADKITSALAAQKINVASSFIKTDKGAEE